MSKLSILRYPDPRLKRVATKITSIDLEIKKLAMDMAETMYYSGGIGLAATQVNVHKQLIVVDTSPEKSSLYTLINPIIIESQGCIEFEEGCLSVPDTVAKVSRAAHIKLEALNLEGRKIHLEADDLFAVCIQHEIDHLKGIVFVDYLSRLKRDRITKKIVKLGGRQI